MTGPEHYAEAESIIEDLKCEDPENPVVSELNLRLAQVHATLAVAASHVEPISMWREAIHGGAS